LLPSNFGEFLTHGAGRLTGRSRAIIGLKRKEVKPAIIPPR
jgi:hypothetical protein